MEQRASPGTLVIARISGRDVLGDLSCLSAGAFASILTVFLAAMIFSSPATVQPAAAMENLTHRVMLPLITRNADGCTSGQPCDIVVRVEDVDGNPIEGARILALYTDSEDQTTSMSRVTDESGEAIFPGADREIIFEVQFPVGLVPCPGSPPRVQTSPGQTFVKFVGCRL